MDAPRAIIEVSGSDVKWQDIISLRLEQTLYMAADSFDITLNNDNLLSDWLRKEQEVKIYLGYVKNPDSWGKSDLTHVFTGKIDGVKPNFQNPNTVEIIGRDYSARMIDTESTLAFNNQASGEIAQYFASKYGLNFIGQMGEVEIDKEMITGKKEWDILQALADREGFVCYVDKDMNLYFGPRQDSDESITYTFSRAEGKINCSIDFDDSSVGVISKVTVRHWYRKRHIEASAENAKLSQSIGQVKERIIFDAKAKNYELAKQIAEKRLKELSREVVTASINSYMVSALIPEKKVAVEGCGRFNGDYYVEQVTTEISSSGATAQIDATNLRPDDAEQYRDDLYDNNDETA